MEEMPSGERITARRVGQTAQELYGRRVRILSPPPERPHAMEESLGALYSWVLMYLEAVERNGGIKAMVQDWARDRKQDFLRQVAEILARWTIFVG